jgi:hypothetical protein
VSDDIVFLAASSMRARRRPGAVAGTWAWQSALALMASWPAVGLVRAAYGRSPSGDAALWEAGSLPLLGLLSRESNGVRAATGAAVVVLIAGAIAGLVPLAAMMFSIGSAGPDGRGIGAARALGQGVRVFRPLGILLVAVTFTQALAVAAAIFFGQLVEAWTHRSLGEARSQALGIAVGATLAPCVVVLGVMHDLARAAVVRRDLKPFQALVAGTRLLRAAPLALTWSWAWRALAALAPVAAVAALADRIGGRGGLALVVLAALHQLVVVARVAFRASWLAKALRTVDAAAPSRALAFTESAGD